MTAIIRPRAGQSGISIVELMIGLTIAMIASVAIFNVVIGVDRQGRIANAVSDAQMAGTIASFAMERELQQAGYGLGRIGTEPLGCPLVYSPVAGGVRGAPQTLPLYPVRIEQGAGGAPDAIVGVVGSSTIVPIRVNFSASTTQTKVLASRAGYRPPANDLPGDLFIAVWQGATAQCSLLQVSGLGADAFTINHVPSAGAPHNPPVNPLFAGPLGGSGFVFNLGRQPRFSRWSVDLPGRELRVTNLLAGADATRPVAENVVDLQAQYGIGGDDPNAPLQWIDTATAAEMRRVLAIRYAIVVQGQQHDANADGSGVTAQRPRWTAADRELMTVLPPDWQSYRYRVYENTVSMRNVLWGR